MVGKSKIVKIYGTLKNKNRQYKLIMRDLKQKTSKELAMMSLDMMAGNQTENKTAGEKDENAWTQKNETVPRRNMSDYSKYAKKELMFDIEVVAGMHYELEINDGQ